MKKRETFLALVIFLTFEFSTSVFYAQQFRSIFKSSYKNLSVHLRIENSGIFGLKSFEVLKGAIYLLKENNEVVKLSNSKKGGYSAKNIFPLRNNDNKKLFFGKYARDFSGGFKLLKYRNGIYSDNKTGIIVNRVSTSELLITEEKAGKRNEIKLKFNGDLAFASLIGIDSAGVYFIEVQRYETQIPLKIKREIIIVNSAGNILNRLIVPTIEYATMENEFSIDARGDLYQILTYPDKLEIVEWEGLNIPSAHVLQYPKEYEIFLHFNNFVSDYEPSRKKVKPMNKSISTTRSEILKKAEQYVEHKYYCSAANLAPGGTVAQDGDKVKTPGWLRKGWNARIPYKWGGFNTLREFDSNLKKGYYAGDIDTKGVSDYAVGVDCSGFVSRCWGLTYHASTRYMPNITGTYNSWEELKPGDAIHKIGHVRLFVERNIDGSLKIVEASARNWDVSYWSYTPSELQAYTPRYLTSLTGSYFEKSVKLLSAVSANKDSVKLKWSCDTTAVIGFRLYSSIDGSNWNLINKNKLVKADSILLPYSFSPEYFRVSAIGVIKGDTAESFFSNPLGVNLSGASRVLIVNGFNRNYGSGSWQGVGNPFTLSYGNALANCKLNFESVKNSVVEKGEVNLENYDAVFWYLGDESTQDESFSSVEESIVEKYLKNGGNLFVSGSEVGWDLDRVSKSSYGDIAFYNNYLKAKYLEDDANSTEALGVPGGPFEGFDFYFGQTFTEDYPDVITNYNGSSLVLKYSNGKGAGVYYKGVFGNSNKSAAVVYFGFTLESMADDSAFNLVVAKIVDLFGLSASSVRSTLSPQGFRLFSPYPNPFNPVTRLSFYLTHKSNIKLEIYNLLGAKVSEIFSGILLPGYHKFEFNGNNLASGVYFSVLSTPGKKYVQKLMLLK